MGIVQIVGCLLVLLVNVVHSDVICMQCDEAATIDECIAAGTIKCGTQEQCFLEKVTTKNLNFVYNAGCRSAVVCNIMSTLGGGNGRRDLSRQSRQLVNCAQCCNTDPGVVAKGPCNSELCGAKPTVDNSIRCLDCDHLVSGSAFCTSREVCTDTQVCATSIHILGGTQIKYNFRCEEKHLCEGMIKNGIHNRASEATGVKICDACCKDEECNKKDCFELRKLMPTQFGNGTAAVTTPKPATPAPTTKPTTPVPTTKPTTPVPTTKPTTPVPTTKPTTPVPTTKPTTPVPTTKPTTPVPTTKPTTPVPTTKPTTPVPTTKPTTPVPTTKSTTPVPTTKPTTPVPTTKSTTPVPTTKPTTPVPTTKPTTPVPTTKSTTPVPTTATTKPTTPVPTTPVPTTPTTPVPTTPTTPVPSTPVPSNNPSTPIASSAPPSGSSRRPSTFAPNFTVI